MLDVVFWDRLFGQSPATAPASPKMADVEFVGSFMLIQFYDGHHWGLADESSTVMRIRPALNCGS